MSTLNGKSVASTYDQVVKRQDSYSATGNQIEIMDDSGVIKTTPLYLDSVNSRVGIGTASPGANTKLDVVGVIRASGGIQPNGNAYSASEVLDDYEEGTWTPVLSDASEAGNVATGASLLGAYTKIGNMVTVTLRAINIDTSGMTAGNDLFIQGLPFNSNGSYNHIGSVATSDIAFSGHIAFYVSGGTNYSKLSDSITGTTTDYTTVADLTSGSADIQGIATYRT